VCAWESPAGLGREIYLIQRMLMLSTEDRMDN
jgi:hypothetical protein